MRSHAHKQTNTHSLLPPTHTVVIKQQTWGVYLSFQFPHNDNVFLVKLDLTYLFQVSFVYIVPPIALQLLKDPAVSRYDLSSVTSLFSGAAPLRQELVKQMKEHLRIWDIRQGINVNAWKFQPSSGVWILYSSADLWTFNKALHMWNIRQGINAYTCKFQPSGAVCIL